MQCSSVLHERDATTGRARSHSQGNSFYFFEYLLPVLRFKGMNMDNKHSSSFFLLCLGDENVQLKIARFVGRVQVKYGHARLVDK